MTATNNITTSTVTINNYPSTYIPTKVCNTCRIIKQLTEFYKDNKSRDGYCHKCKNCLSEQYKEYNTKHKDDLVKYRKDYYEANKDIKSQKSKEYYIINKDKIL